MEDETNRGARCRHKKNAGEHVAASPIEKAPEVVGGAALARRAKRRGGTTRGMFDCIRRARSVQSRTHRV